MFSDDSDIINGPGEFNRNLINKPLSLDDLKVYLRLKFQDYKASGHVAGISETRVRQILIGYNVPKSAKLIRQIAAGWGIDEIKLTQLFSRISIPDIRESYGTDKLKEEGKVASSETPLDIQVKEGEKTDE